MANLLDNAIKYSDKKSTVNIKIITTPKDLIFEITDKGVGMVSEDANHLFEKFYRNKDMSFKHIHGSGLGLYIVQKFIDAHKGKVWANSAGREKGSTFGFSLPR